ncbi:MAG: hypothetical protein JXO51_11205 [Candidatus Aminicenantes bacterium]|nr:hypothetical protein [Candidatus Aminicenantes bacterium]
MKKVIILTLMIIVFALFLAGGIDKEQIDAWTALVGEKDLKVKMEKLDDYFTKYGDREDRYTLYMYLHLAETTYHLQQYDRTIQFGEKALGYEEIETGNKMRVFLYLANAYNLTKKDLDKSYDYAEKIIALANSLRRGNQSTSLIDNSYTAPALRIQVQLLATQAQDPQKAIQALDKALKAYELDKSDKSANFVLALSKHMLEINKVEEAIRGVESLNKEKPNTDYYKMLGIWYARLKNLDKAIENLKASYEMKRNAKVAYDLGVLLNQNQALDEAMQYLAESHLLNDEKYSEDALKLLQHLVFFEKTKGQPQPEQEKVFNEIMAEAKSRLGITLP